MFCNNYQKTVNCSLNQSRTKWTSVKTQKMSSPNINLGFWAIRAKKKHTSLLRTPKASKRMTFSLSLLHWVYQLFGPLAQIGNEWLCTLI